MAAPDRLALAFETGALALPEAGDVLVLRAEPSRFPRPRCRRSGSAASRPSARLQTPSPRAAMPVATAAEGEAAMAIVVT